MLDTVRTIETPEGVALTVRVAGPVPRALAWGIDQLLRMFVWTVLGSPLALMGETGVGLMLIGMFALEWFYPVYFEVRWDGATPGKQVLGLKVVHDDGTPVGWSASVIRNLLRFGDFLPVAYGIGLAAMLMDRDFRRLGDLAASTLVVYAGDAGARAAPPVEGAPLAPPVALSLDAPRAVLDFAGRSKAWSEERREEVALLLAPLWAASTGPQALSRVLGLAAWLSGRR